MTAEAPAAFAAPTAGGAALVALGGAAGTVLRAAVTGMPAWPDGLPWATLAVNVTGAFLLGALLGTGARDAGRRARLLLGTGLLGGYTTFATVGLELHRLAASGRPSASLGYLALTVLAGLVAGGLGIAATGRRWARS